MENKSIRLLRWLNPLEPWQWGMTVVIFFIMTMIYITVD